MLWYFGVDETSMEVPAISPQRQTLLDGEPDAAIGDETVQLAMQEEELHPHELSTLEFLVREMWTEMKIN